MEMTTWSEEGLTVDTVIWSEEGLTVETEIAILGTDGRVGEPMKLACTGGKEGTVQGG